MLPNVGHNFKTRFQPGHETGWDAIVIGSGAGGLATANLMARQKAWRVLVLEQHYTPGGYCHAFRRGAFEWDVGVHYIGDVTGPEAQLRPVFDKLTEGHVDWAPMPEVYDQIRIGDTRYDFHAGRQEFIEGLAQHFPRARKPLGDYLDTIRDVARSGAPFFAEKVVPPFVANLFGSWMRKSHLRYADQTVAEALAKVTDDPQLKAVLAGQWGDYGLPPAEASFAMHAVVAQHYIHGAAFPIGGASRLVEGLANPFLKRGGALYFNAHVRGIAVAEGGDGAVRGVIVEDGTSDGTFIAAPVVVSDAGALNTFTRLLDKPTADRAGAGPILAAARPSAAHLSLYVALDRPDAEVGITGTNRWIYTSPDHDGVTARYRADITAPFPLVYLSFPSAKDPSSQGRCPGFSTLELVVPAYWSQFEKWVGTRWHHRGEGYEDLKAQLTARLLDVLYDEVPAARGHVVHAELSTPLSTAHFAAYGHGEIYGLDHTPSRYRLPIGPRTGVPGLWLTGQDVCTAGVAGALMGGVLTASGLLRKFALSGLR
jgi:all-trans-retinol 13,14-reductase